MSDSIQRTSVGNFPISQTVTVPASASLIFVSGTLPDAADPQVPGVYGNTEVQTVSVFNKLRKVLQQQDYSRKFNLCRMSSCLCEGILQLCQNGCCQVLFGWRRRHLDEQNCPLLWVMALQFLQ